MENDNPDKNRVHIGIVAAELMDFYDKFAEFHDYCAFLCDSFSSLAAKKEPIDTGTANGVMLFADWVKYRALLLKTELNDIRRELHKTTAGQLHSIK